MTQENNTLDLLLKMDLPAPQEKEIKIKRLSDLCGAPVVFKIRQISYNRITETVEQHRFDGEASIFTVLAGTASPNLKSPELLKKFQAETPAELLKKMLLPGEIEDIDREIEKLCGYRYNTLEEVEEVKKK